MQQDPFSTNKPGMVVQGRGIAIWAQPWAKTQDPIQTTTKKKKRAGSVVEGIEHFSSKYKALSSARVPPKKG
jgi:hypothetical protein